MNANKAAKLEKQLTTLRSKRFVTYGNLNSFARKIGRRKLTGAQARGSEPNWVSDEFLEMRPISIPFHGKNNTCPTGTAKNIMNDFEEDVLRLKLKYPKEKDEQINAQQFEGYEQ